MRARQWHQQLHFAGATYTLWLHEEKSGVQDKVWKSVDFITYLPVIKAKVLLANPQRSVCRSNKMPSLTQCQTGRAE